MKDKNFFWNLWKALTPAPTKDQAYHRHAPDFMALEPRILFSVAPFDVDVEAFESDTSLNADSDAVFPLDTPDNDVYAEIQHLMDEYFGDLDFGNDPIMMPDDSDFSDYQENGLLLDAIDGLESQQPVELIFVDQDTPDYLTLIDSILADAGPDRNFRLVLLSNDADGISQISDALSEYSDVSALHLVSHGTGGKVDLGNTMLTLNSLQGYAGEIAGWNGNLQSGADILIYGCDLASTVDGQSLLQSISALSDADVAASDDLTGHESLGGDWDLEYHVGEITTEIIFGAAFQQDYQYILQVNIDQAWLDANGSNGPYYLDQAGETYVLQTDVTTDGTAFAVIADDITFDLNGHTVTYNNAAPINIVNSSFENGTGALADGWDFSGATTAERYDGVFLENEIYDGDFSLHFGSGFTGEQTVFSTSTITLEANTKYSLSAMFKNVDFVSGTSSFVKLVGQNIGDEHEVQWGKKNSRGIQWKENVFTTGSAAETYQLVVGVDNSIGDLDFSAFIDDISIQKTKNYGLALGPQSWDAENFPGVTQWGNAHDFHLTSTVAGGSITQGQDEATWSHGIHYRRANNAEIDNVTITVSGANTNAIHLPGGSTIHDNTLISNVTTIETRDAFDGAVLDSSGLIYGNTIIGGPHTGIFSSDAASEIYENEISIRSRYTNGFGIMLWDDQGSEVYDNIIDYSTGDFGGRGIHVNRDSGTHPDTVIRNNDVTVKEVALNQEYGGAVLGGAYGIQLEAAGNVQVYQNTVHALADESDAAALRLNNYKKVDQNVTIYDNVFTATRSNTLVSAASMKFQKLTTDTGVVIRDNILESDHQWLGDTWQIDGEGATLTDNTFTVIGAGTDFVPVEGHNWGSGVERDLRAIQGLRFVDNNYSSTLAESLFEDSAIGNWFGGTETTSSIFQSFTHTFVVTDLSGDLVNGALVTIDDIDGNEVFSGTTDSSGRVMDVLDEFLIEGSDKTGFGPYTVTTSYGGEVETQTFDADQKQTIALSFDVDFGGGDSNPPASINNSGLTLDEGAISGINNSMLLFEDSQQPASSVEYTITGGLANGQLELTTAPTVAITSFTQDDINSGRLVYRHDDSETTSDSFTFTVDDGHGNASSSQTFDITVNLVDDSAAVSVNNVGVTLNEGATTGIDNSQLRFDDSEQAANSVVYSVSDGLDNGHLELTTAPTVAITSFTQDDIDSGRLVYRHDDSDTTSDSFTFTVDDGQGNLTSSQTFDITVDPIDDTAPSSVNNTGAIIEAGSLVEIEKSNLHFHDSEQASSDVTYSVIGGLENGQLELTTDPDTAISTFTQADIDAGLLVYRHHGGEEMEDHFDFVVADGLGNSASGQFMLTDEANKPEESDSVFPAPNRSGFDKSESNSNNGPQLTDQKRFENEAVVVEENQSLNDSSGPAKVTSRSTLPVQGRIPNESELIAEAEKDSDEFVIGQSSEQELVDTIAERPIVEQVIQPRWNSREPFDEAKPESSVLSFTPAAPTNDITIPGSESSAFEIVQTIATDRMVVLSGSASVAYAYALAKGRTLTSSVSSKAIGSIPTT